MQPKPDHLGQQYAAQFEDISVARAYHARPPYPDAVFDCIDSLALDRPRRMLELGAGTGDLSFGLASRVDQLDALEPSAAMLDIARGRQAKRGGPDNIRWIHASAEAHEFTHVYCAVVAAESLHWTRWDVVFPAIARCLTPSGLLVIVCDRLLLGLPWQSELRELIARFSTNRDFQAYDVAHEITTRGLFTETGRTQVIASFAQSLEDYVESFHSRNGFSRERMGVAAAAFDRELRDLVIGFVASERVEAQLSTTLIWGKPQAA